MELHNRRKGDAVRLEIETPAHPEIVERLRINFELEEDQVFRGQGPVNLSRVMFLYSDVARPDLKFLAIHAAAADAEPQGQRTSLRTCARAISCCIIPTTPMIPVVNFIQLGAQDPGGGEHQADALPHQPGFADVPGAVLRRRPPRKPRWWWS